jgi:hypothetical protein
MFFFPILLGSAFPAYIFMFLILIIELLCSEFKIHILDWFVVVFLVFVWILKYLQVGLNVTEVLFRNYSGWLIVYFFFKTTAARIKMDRLLLLFCISVIFEAILINTIITPSALPNYSDDFEQSTHNTAFMGFYRRPMSMGGNASISSTIIVLMLLYLENLRKKGSGLVTWKLEMLALIAIILFASGTGFFLYFVYRIYKLHIFSRKRNIVLFILVIAIIVMLINYASIHPSSIISKVSYKYFEFLWEFKIKQIEDVLNELQESSMVIGGIFSRDNVRIWSDFALLDLFHSLGISGLVILFVFSLSKINDMNLAVIFVGILGMVHYGAIISMPGQLIFAYALMLDKNNIDYYRAYAA